mmetsp:Transcript_36510/g.77670  ORF Transcript_36510/g.77670 Transcript_36510/m.77670 type:complete len:328 (-) Transcript_36510:40-1023(-)
MAAWDPISTANPPAHLTSPPPAAFAVLPATYPSAPVTPTQPLLRGSYSSAVGGEGYRYSSGIGTSFVLPAAAFCAAFLRGRGRHLQLRARSTASLANAGVPSRHLLRGPKASTRQLSTARAAGPAGAQKPGVVFLIGGPGSGKGTQCERIASDLGYHHLSAGELLRAERKVEGSKYKEIIDKAIVDGKTVPSEVIAGLLEKAMRNSGWEKSRFVIDGYPRSQEQLKGWEDTLSSKVNLMFCLSLTVSREEMKRRLLGRAATSGRADDNEVTIEKRFVTFNEETGPLLKHFDEQGKLREIDGDRSPEDVWAEVQQTFKKYDEEAEAAA